MRGLLAELFGLAIEFIGAIVLDPAFFVLVVAGAFLLFGLLNGGGQ